MLAVMTEGLTQGLTMLGPGEQALVFGVLVFVAVVHFARTVLQTLHYFLEIIEKLLGN